MTGGLYSRVKTWGATDVLTNTDLNAEFDNILNNFIPQMMSGYSATVGQMQTQTNPGSVGTESLAVALSGEIERIRFQLAAITGNTYWYSSPGASISQLVTALGTASLANKIASGLTNGVTGSLQPIFLKPDGTLNTVTLKASVTPFVYSIAGTSYTISTDVAITALTTAPTVGNTCVVSDTSVDNSARTKLLGENGSVITVATMGAAISSLIGSLAVFKTANGTAEYILARVESTTQLTQVMRGYFFNSSNTLMGRQTVNNTDTLTLQKLTWIYATTTGGITPVYTNPRVAGTAPSSPATGDYWFDTVANYWKSYSGTTWIQANATLIGVCFQNSTGTIGARSFDFFEAYASTNTAELFVESTTEVRTRNTNAQVSVYGATFNFGPDFIRWDTPGNNDSGVTVGNSTMYYLYLNTQGNPLISDVAPYDRRGDLQGYYHPANTYRCLGTVFTTAAGAFSELNSFYKSDFTDTVTTFTAAVSNFPVPYGVTTNQKFIVLDATAGAFTQVIPPPAQWKGNFLTYQKKDNTFNVIKLQAWGQLVLTTTGTVATGANTITTMASTTGLATGMLVSGNGVPPGTTITTVGAGNVTMGNNANRTLAGGTILFANSTGIDGLFQTYLATQYESLTLYSDGTNVYVMNRTIPSISVSTTTTFTAVTTAPTKGGIAVDLIHMWRQGNMAHFKMELSLTTSGTSGSGNYLLTLPYALSVDPGAISFYTGADGALASAYNSGLWVGGASGVSNYTGLVVPYDSTHVRFCSESGTGTGFVSSAGVLPFNTANISHGALFSLPIANWAAG